MALCGALLVLALIVQLARKQLHGNRPVGGRCDDFIRPLLGACADGLLFHDRRFAQFSAVDTG